jgi:3-hydroxyisobutyrate dehydrogenase
MSSIAFLGLGTMGRGMASRLLAKGFDVAVWNRTSERAKALVSEGARVAASPADAAAGADIVISMVADDAASRTVWLDADGALARAKRGAVMIESSTLSPGWIAELGARVAERGCELIDAPVTGSKTHAAAGDLLFLVGGTDAALTAVRPVLAVMGSRGVLHLGPLGSGARLKLINNFVCGVQAAALAEAVALMERVGLDTEKAFPVLGDGAPGSPLVKGVGPRMLQHDYAVNFHLALMHKDLSYAMAEGERAGVPLHTAAAARDRFADAIAAGAGAQDFSAVVEPLRAGRP